MQEQLEKLRLLRIELSHYEWAQDDRALGLVAEMRNRHHFTPGNRVGHRQLCGLATQRCVGCDQQLADAISFTTRGALGCYCVSCDDVVRHLVTQMQDHAIVLGADWQEMLQEARKPFWQIFAPYLRRNLNHNQHGWHLFG